jgi:hypothetical protein
MAKSAAPMPATSGAGKQRNEQFCPLPIAAPVIKPAAAPIPAPAAVDKRYRVTTLTLLSRATEKHSGLFLPFDRRSTLAVPIHTINRADSAFRIGRHVDTSMRRYLLHALPIGTGHGRRLTQQNDVATAENDQQEKATHAYSLSLGN